ncbi:DUF6317 family protein [Nocardia sp. NBC_01503]|uniref:DUF6317 family protein n=1 Tax=Nocardia sp. NBC_01503 TaxID=2975997 RepID=UPI002E7C3A68|nr:DUF6317 family protein [Nocardia sp. NBC_01503]WTL33695.1 DUF6317 family protein [Nocardia sp. NBC_01503]
MSGFEVVLDDLKSMAKTFGDEATTYEGRVPGFLPAAVDSGDGTLNEAMKGILELLEILNHQVVRTIQTHSDKLAYARDSYERHDIDNRKLFDDLTQNLD